MKKMIKSALAFALAVFVGQAAWAEDKKSTASITLEKTVSQRLDDVNDRSNATLRIVSNIKHTDYVYTNKILLVGSLCSSHGLKESTVTGTISNLLEKGDVTWKLYYNDQSYYQSSTAPATLQEGSQEKGSTFKGSITVPESSHKTLDEMLAALDSEIPDATHSKYDYIVLEFDGSRIADRELGDPDLSARVAQKLAWYYENNRVIWITDACAAGTKEPYAKDYYRPTSAFFSNSESQGWTVDTNEWEALVAMLDPDTYLSNPAGSRFTEKIDDWDRAGNRTTGAKQRGPGNNADGWTVWAAKAIEQQAAYTNLAAITEILDRTIKPPPDYVADASDAVATFNSSLEIKGGASGVTVYKWTGKSAPVAPSGKYIADAAGWTKDTEAVVSVSGSNLSVTYSNVVNDAWNKIEIALLADKDMVKNAGATLNEDGKFEIDPNYGEMSMTLSRDEHWGEGYVSCLTVSTNSLNRWLITPVVPSISVQPVNKVYDGKSASVVATVTPANVLTEWDGKIEYSTNGGKSWSDTNPAFTNVTEKTVWCRAVFDNPVALGCTNTGSVVITPASLVFTVNATNKVYGAATKPVLDALAKNGGWSVTGAVEGEEEKVKSEIAKTVSFTRVSSDEDVGTYGSDIVTNKLLNAGSNYKVTSFTPGDFEITPAPLTVVPNAGQHVCEGDEVNVKFTATGFKYTDSQTKNYVGGSYSLESQALGKQAIVDDGGWDFGKNYTVVSSDTQGRTFEIQECSCQQLYCAYAYRVKLAGKTVTGKEVTRGTAGACDYESNCWAKPTSYRVAGYIFNASPTEPAECEECECNAFDNIQTVFWTADRKQTFADEEVTFDTFDILRNGGFKNKAQLCIKIGENIKLAGFGAFNPLTGKLKSANGFFAGALVAPTCGKLGEDCEWGTTPAQVFEPCALTEPVNSEAAIVYGRWTMTYKADKVRQIEKDNNFGCLYPTGWQPKAE